MTEDGARGWIAARFGGDAVDRIACFLDLVVAENAAQNLVAPSTIATIWARHAVDSAQLVALAPGWSSWIDVGTGGGFPGMIVALLANDRPVTMVEPRRKRAAFLQSCVDALGIPNAIVAAAKVQAVASVADVISARAVATIERLLQAAAHCATEHTTWLLPRGKLGDTDLAMLGSLRSTMFHVEHSVTDPASTIVVLEGNGR